MTEAAKHTPDKAEFIARQLFPDEIWDGSDCRNESGREGQPCRICADQAERWTATIEKVRAALAAATNPESLGFDPDNPKGAA